MTLVCAHEGHEDRADIQVKVTEPSDGSGMQIELLNVTLDVDATHTEVNSMTVD